ncbi:hypothetical protein ACQ4PT_019695 [Festuca glaucescens]
MASMIAGNLVEAYVLKNAACREKIKRAEEASAGDDAAKKGGDGAGAGNKTPEGSKGKRGSFFGLAKKTPSASSRQSPKKTRESPAMAAPMPGGEGEGQGRPVVLVTGCSEGGIGNAMARAFAAAGCAVVATARSRSSMRGLEGDPRYLVLELDVGSDESARRAVGDALREFGRVDVLVNNAGVHLVAPLAEVPMDSFQQVFDTNVYGAMRMIQAVIPHMMERRKGTIVNVGSITALAPGPWAGAYSASKAALHALSDTLRVELRNFGINVMIVAQEALSQI